MDNELFPLVDNDGNVIGKATRKECHSGSKLLHPVVHLHVFNSNGEIYLQKRSHNKLIQPSKWDTSVGGHVDYGETIIDALTRETCEEIGLTEFKPIELFKYVFESKVERELVNAFYTVTDRKAFDFDPVEVDDGRYWSIEEIIATIGKGILTPNFESEFVKLNDKLHLY